MLATSHHLLPTPVLPRPPTPTQLHTIPSPTLAPLPLLPPSPSLPPTLDIHHRHTHHVRCSGCSGSHQLGPAARRNSRGPCLLPASVQCLHPETWETWIMVGEGGEGGEQGRSRKEGGNGGSGGWGPDVHRQIIAQWMICNGYGTPHWSFWDTVGFHHILDSL